MKTDINFLYRRRNAKNFSFSHFMVALLILVASLIGHYQYLLNNLDKQVRNESSQAELQADQGKAASMVSASTSLYQSAESLIFARLIQSSIPVRVSSLDIDHTKRNASLELKFLSRDGLHDWLEQFQGRESPEGWRVRGMNILERDQEWNLRLDLNLADARRRS